MNNSEKRKFIEDYVSSKADYLQDAYNISLDEINILNIIDSFNQINVTSQNEKEILDKLISNEVSNIFRIKEKKNIANNQSGSVILVYLISGIVVIGFILLFIYFLKL